MSDIATSNTNELVEKKIKKDNNEPIIIAKSFKSILSDFNVMPYLISFIIALSFNNLLEKIVQVIAMKMNIRNPLINAFIEFILVLVLIYLFIYEIFYKYLYDETISKEKIMKKALSETKVDEIKKNLKEDVEINENIKKDVQFNHEEPFQSYKYYL
jgi:large-conductance mechanosensitive channel